MEALRGGRTDGSAAVGADSEVALALQLVELAERELDRVLEQLDERASERTAVAAVLDAFVAATGVGHAVVLADGRVEEWSDTATRLTGLSPRPGSRLDGTEQLPAAAVARLVSRTLERGAASGWEETASGAGVPLRVSCAPLPDTGRMLVVFAQAISGT